MRLAVVFALSTPLISAAAGPDFGRQVRPVLSDSCFSCHGPDAKSRMANLRLDTREGLLSKVVPGRPDESPLFQRITHANPALRMPPGRTLTEAQRDAIRSWIASGAKWEQHWSYSAPVRPEPPATKFKAWVRNPIDAFVAARLEKEGLKPSPEADRATLLRRVSLDLTGLPPTPRQVRAFLADKSPDAYEKVVDELLRSPHYGEKMAMSWLDLARYADTHGYHIDSHRDMFPWRDWVIKAFNDNMPFDRFVTDQLAGDLAPGATREQLIATGFNRNHMINFEGGAIAEEYLAEYVMDRAETTATVFLGMTMGCARCHDHKYDPVSQKDYYRFFAFFNSIDEKGLDGQRGNAKPFLVVDPGSEKEYAQIDAEMKTLREELDSPEARTAQAAWEKSQRDRRREPVKEGLAVHYEFDGSLADSSGHYRYARTGGTEPAFSAGMVAKAISLTVDDRLVLTDEVLLDEARPFTMALFVQPTHERSVRVLSKGPVEIVSDGSVAVPIGKRGALWRFRFGDIRFVTKDHVLFNRWTHVALRYDGSRKASGFSLYLNGQPAAVEILEQGGRARFSSGEPLAVSDYQGQMDDLRVYERALEEGEIARIALHEPAARLCEVPESKRSKEEKDRLKEYWLMWASPEPWKGKAEQVRRLQARRDHMDRFVATTMIMKEMETPRDSFVLARGDYRNRKEKVTAGVPSALPPLPKDAPANRLGLARWLVDPGHPLTARVTVNRFWQQYFGAGIVKTSEDFGSQGEPPSHPELLDWLATEFIRTGWDIRAMQRLIVTSATYRQSSRAPAALWERDPDNRLLARMSRFRLPAEIVRDNALAASGLLNPEMGGRGVFPYQPAGLWDEMAFGREFTAQRYTPSSGKDLYRRSMYTFWKRTVPPAALATFDAPDREKCTSRRAVTNTPLQALVLMNDPTYVEAARRLATGMLREGGATPEARIGYAFERVLARKALKEEIAVLREAAARQLRVYEADREAAARLLRNGESPADASLDAAELAAWTNVATMILNLDEAITKE